MEKAEIEAENIRILTIKIKQFLLGINMKTHIRGFKFWTTAILYAVEKELKNEDLGPSMLLYTYVGKQHKATAAKVEKGMRYALEDLDLQNAFDIDYSINNTAFLNLAKEEILNKLISNSI